MFVSLDFIVYNHNCKLLTPDCKHLSTIRLQFKLFIKNEMISWSDTIYALYKEYRFYAFSSDIKSIKSTPRVKEYVEQSVCMLKLESRLNTGEFYRIYFKVQNEMFFFIAEFEGAAKIRKIAFYRFLISLLVPEV